MNKSSLRSRSQKVIIISRCSWTMYNFRLSLIKSIKAEGHEVIALGAGGDGYEERLEAEGVDFRVIPVAKRGLNPIADAWLLLRLVLLLALEKPDVVHCFTIKPVIYGTLAAWLCGVRARITTITGLGHAFTSASKWLSRVVGALYKLALTRAHIVYFQNQDDRELFVERKLVAPWKAHLCAGSGVDLARFSPIVLPLAAGAVTPRFLMISRLIREKGVVEFLEAARIVRERYANAEFWLLGGEDSRNPSALSSAEVEALKVSKDVKWLGAAPDVRPFIAQADVIVLPSYREGLPRSLLEAGAMGRAAIATDVVGCRDVVVHEATGLLVPPQDAAGLAEAAIEFIRHPHRVLEMGRAARQRVVDHFDENLVVSDTIREYNRLTNRESVDGEPIAPA